MVRTQAATQQQHANIESLGRSWQRSLRAENKSPKTVQTYREAVEAFDGFLAAQGITMAASQLTREHVEMFITDQLARWKPATASVRFRALQQFFQWTLEEGELKQSPMARMRPPIVPVEPPPVLGEEQLGRLLRACDGGTFQARRDRALILLLLDTGMRRGELAGLKVDDIDLERNLAVVLGKGRRPRACPFGRKTAQALDRYLRLRATHRATDSSALWLGKAGLLTSNGVYQVVRDVATRAGLPDVYPHQLRHSFAHAWLSNGGSETDLMQLTGWKSRTMLQRYGASAAAERAREAHKRLSPGDRL